MKNDGQSTGSGSARLEQYRRAALGDEAAKRQVEARELLRAADDVTSKLRDRAETGDQQAVAALKQIASGKLPSDGAAGPTATGAPAFTAADVAKANRAATKRERERWSTVLRSEHANGRERGCTALLSSDKAWTAAQIIAALPNLPTDRETACKNPQASARVDAVWAKAHGSGEQDDATAAGAPRTPADDVWDQAHSLNAHSRGI